MRDRATKVIETTRRIIERFREYDEKLHYPGEWGERAFRAWLAFEVFHLCLGWPISHIIFGEKFDVLFVDDRILPVIYLETKRPGRGLAEVEEFKERILSEEYSTLKYGILTDGYEWLKYDAIRHDEHIVSLDHPPRIWTNFIKGLEARNYLSLGRRVIS